MAESYLRPIAHILSSFGMGGQERVALDLAIGQQGLGHRVLAVSLAAEDEGPQPLADDFRAHGVEVVNLPKRGGFDVRLPARLGLLFARVRPWVVHTHNPQPLIYAALPARLARATLIHTKHGVNPDSARRVALRRAAARLTDGFVAVSEATAEVARRQRESARREVRVIPNGIDLSRFSADRDAGRSVRDELGIPPQAWVVGTVGRLYPEKAHAYLLSAAEPLLGESFHLVIAGDGPEAGPLAEQAARSRAPQSIHLIGARRDVPRVLAALDTFVLSSESEGLPLVIPEAMAAGLPVVSTAVGGIPKVVREGSTGFLVPAGDEAALRERLAALEQDRELAENCGAHGRALALAEYSCQRMVRDYLALYEQATRK